MKLAILVLAAGLLAGCGSAASSVPAAPTALAPAATIPAVSPTSAPAARLGPATRTPAPAVTHHRRPAGALIAIADEGRVTYSVTLRPGQCHARDSGRLPDPACTPGSVDPAVTQSGIYRTICVHGWTATVRPPSGETTRAKYDVARPAYGSTVPGELDHLVPLELGGANDITNLWPEAGAIPNGKDSVENELRAAVCAGRVTLRAARLAIARDWETAPVPAPPPPASVAPVPPPSSHAAPVASSRAPASCYPRTSGGNCYRAGEFCRTADRGTSGIAGNGERIRCVTSGSRNRWEPA